MPKFRKKPIIVDAEKFNPAFRKSDGAYVKQLGVYEDAPWTIDSSGYHRGTFYIDTPEGRSKVSIGDWIIKGVKGELYPCKPDIFDKTYEPITEKSKQKYADKE